MVVGVAEGVDKGVVEGEARKVARLQADSIYICIAVYVVL